MEKGYLMFVLNAHLPFVRHPAYEQFVEESWLNDAISETYLPLLRVFNQLENDGVPFCITMAISPTLSAMLSDELLQERYVKYVKKKINLGKREVERTSFDPVFNKLAKMYYKIDLENYEDFTELYKCNILKGFKELEKKGRVRIITSAATHAFLPFYENYPNALEAQVRTAVMSHCRIFGKEPSGFWLPELGYMPGIEKILKTNNIKYFFTAVHSFLLDKEMPKYGIYAPVSTGEANGVTVFCRDIQSSNAIWSYDEGYPGNPIYREFYRDIGFDLTAEYLGDQIYKDGIRVNTGFKYYANTGKPKEEKRPYDPDEALLKIEEHAENFIYNQLKHIKKVSNKMDRLPVINCLYDAQIFGQWWFEGTKWLDKVFRLAAEKKDELLIIGADEYLEKYPENPVHELSFSSWGNNGYARIWCNGTNDWIFLHAHSVVDKMADLVSRFPNETGLKERALNQAAREVLLSQASDWPFIIKTGIAGPYAEKRVKEHVHNFLIIYDNLCRNSVDTEWLTGIERKNNLFPDIDYRIFCKVEKVAESNSNKDGVVRQ